MIRMLMGAGALALASFAAAPAQAQANEMFIGEALLMGSSFCPRDTLEANGQLLSIAEYTALYSLFGSTYGGDSRTNFALPKLPPPVPGMRYCIVVTSGNYPMRP